MCRIREQTWQQGPLMLVYRILRFHMFFCGYLRPRCLLNIELWSSLLPVWFDDLEVRIDAAFFHLCSMYLKIAVRLRDLDTPRNIKRETRHLCENMISKHARY